MLKTSATKRDLKALEQQVDYVAKVPKANMKHEDARTVFDEYRDHATSLTASLVRNYSFFRQQLIALEELCINVPDYRLSHNFYE